MTPEVIASLVNLGSAGAVIIVVVIFLKSIKERDAEWRDFFTVLSSSNRADVQDMRTVSDRITKTLDDLVTAISTHDTRAQSILTAIDSIKVDMARLTRTRGAKAQ